MSQIKYRYVLQESKVNWTLFFFSDPKSFQAANDIPRLVQQLSSYVGKITMLSKAASVFNYLQTSPFATGK